MTVDDAGRSAAGREVVRLILVPTSVSEQAQQFLGMDLFGGDVARAVPNDIAGWRTLIKETDELLVAVMGAEVEHLHDSVDLRSVDGVPVFVVTPLDVGEVGDTRPIYLDIHGGSLLMGGGKACEVMARRAAAQVQMQTWSVDYRMPPDHPYPAALDDVLAVYRDLLDVIDLAFVVDDGHPADAVADALRAAGGELLESVHLFDVYRGPGIDGGKRSLAYRLRFCADDRTLTDEEVGGLRARCIDAVAGEFGAVLR